MVPTCSSLPACITAIRSARRQGLEDVVRHEDDGLQELLLQAQELLLKAVTGDGVQGTEGLVHEQIGGSAARARATPTRCCCPPESSVGYRDPKVIGSEPDELQQFPCPLLTLALWATLKPQNHGDVFLHGHVREEADALEHVADGAAKLDRVLARTCPAPDLDGPGGRLDQAVDHLQRRGLAATRGAEQDEQLPGCNRRDTSRTA